GSKITYRGRNMPLTARRPAAERIPITYRNGFTVDLPLWARVDADHLVASELKLWLKQRVRRDVQEIAADYGKRFGLVPRSIRTTDLAHGWGSCGPEGNILINWHLIFAPRKVLEYVVVHELAHLRYRSHGQEFWAYLATLMPGSESSRSWLDRHQSALSASFLA
ncbi:MAG: YgjP-like metallopeptidase domain-containing protein, partial [Novosphingobium sp.]